MADPIDKHEPATPAEGEATNPSRLRVLLRRVTTVAVTHWKRTIAAGVTVLVLMAGIALAWTYMVNLAIKAERSKLDEALDRARRGQLRTSPPARPRRARQRGPAARASLARRCSSWASSKPTMRAPTSFPSSVAHNISSPRGTSPRLAPMGCRRSAKSRPCLLLGKSLIETLEIERRNRSSHLRPRSQAARGRRAQHRHASPARRSLHAASQTGL